METSPSSASQREGAGRQSYWTPEGGGKGARPASAGAKPAAAPTQFKRRDSVQHAKFGVGTVIESTIVGGDEEVTVAFPGIGIKRLSVAIAGLKKL